MTLLPTKMVPAQCQGCCQRNLLPHDDAPDALHRRTSAIGNFTVGLLLADQRLSGEWQAPIFWRIDLFLHSAISSAMSPAITGELPVLPVAHGDNPTALPYPSISR